MTIKIKFYLLSLILFWLIGCGGAEGKVIAKIPEASGISYCAKDNTLVVVNDEGRYYEIDLKGNILSQTNLGKYDLEGVVCEDSRLIFAVENRGVLVLDKKTGTHEIVPVDDTYDDKKLDLFDKKAGVEGIEKVGNIIYLSKQSKAKDESFIAVIEMSGVLTKIVELIKHDIADIAGLAYYDGSLYMVSDKEDLLVKYNLATKKITKKTRLEKGAWEGIAIDNEGMIYLADDDGLVVKYQNRDF